MNIAMALRGFDLEVALLGALGQDKHGDDLLEACRKRGIVGDYIYRSEDLAKDRYLAIEDATGLIAAVADAHSLEAAGDKILRPLRDGSLATPHTPFQGTVVLDGNLTGSLLEQIALDRLFYQSDLRLAPASPDKAKRLSVFLGQGQDRGQITIYLNLQEASVLCHQTFENTADAAIALVELGGVRAVVTDGGNLTSVATEQDVFSTPPPKVAVVRVTGAGDVFMASHIAAERAGSFGKTALTTALQSAATYISTEHPL